MKVVRLVSVLLACACGFAFARANKAPDVQLDFSYASGVNPSLKIERLNCSLNTASMDANEGSKLADLVSKSGILSASDRDFDMLDGGPSYHLQVKSGDAAKKFDWSPGHAPKSIDKLVGFLETYCKAHQ